MDKNMKKNMPIMLTALTILLLANFQLPAIQQQAEKSFLKEIFLRKQFCLSGGLSMFGVNGKGNDYMARPKSICMTLPMVKPSRSIRPKISSRQSVFSSTSNYRSGRNCLSPWAAVLNTAWQKTWNTYPLWAARSASALPPNPFRHWLPLE
jgi:hypothetical protein